MNILFVERKGMELRYERACLLIYFQGKRINSVALIDIERIVVSPDVTLSSGVLGLLAEKEVALIVVNARYPDRTATLSGTITGDINRRLQQYACHQNSDMLCYWSQQLILQKIRGHLHFLTQMKYRRADLRFVIMKALRSLKTIEESLINHQETSLNTLRGKEGAAGAVFFKAYIILFSSQLNFTGRNRRPPKDPVNVCLSLAYTLVYQEALSVIKTVGLDPALGCLHAPTYHRASLACDLIEPIRPLIDAWVYQLFQSKVLNLDYFTQTDRSILGVTGKKVFYTEYRQKVPALRKLLRRYAQIAVQAITTGESYAAY